MYVCMYVRMYVCIYMYPTVVNWMIEFGALHLQLLQSLWTLTHPLRCPLFSQNMKQLPSSGKKQLSNQETNYHTGKGEEGDKTTHGVLTGSALFGVRKSQMAARLSRNQVLKNMKIASSF